jgi:hypothetical protein
MKVQERFVARSSAYRRTTNDYQRLQERFVGLAAVPSLRRFDVFMAFAEMRGIRWSTKGSYWTAVQTMLEAVTSPSSEQTGHTRTRVQARSP